MQYSTLIDFLAHNAHDLHILYVEDEKELQHTTFKYLRKFFQNIDLASNGLEALELYQNRLYDLVITDLNMPKMDGMKLIKEIKKIHQNQEIIVISAHSEQESLMKAISYGINGYLLKPIDFNVFNTTLYNSVYKIKKIKENEAYKNNLIQIVEAKTHEVTNLLEDKVKNLQNSIFAFVDLIEKRDSYTAGHSSRVAYYSTLIARACGICDEETYLLYQAAMLHDIGKVTTPDVILLKPGRLDRDEFQLMKEHVTSGYDLLIGIPMYKEHAKIMRYHHEKYDGTGYPDGLKGNQIPTLSSIMSIADAFDSMTTSRIYQARKNKEEALTEIEKYSGTQFHPEIAAIAIKELNLIHLPENVTQIPKNSLEETRYSYYFRDQLNHALYNENYFKFIMGHESVLNPAYNKVCAFYIHNLSTYSNQNGWDSRNRLIDKVSQYIINYNKELTNFRIHDNVFLTFLPEDELNSYITYCEEFLKNPVVEQLDIEIKFTDFDFSEKDSLKKVEKFLFH